MKFILSLSRNLFIFTVWTIGFAFWFQKLLTSAWGFNPFDRDHWAYLRNLWRSGWTITSPREWLFVLLLFAAIPLWLTGWAIVTNVSWYKWFKIILLFPLKLIAKAWRKHKEAKAATVKPKVTKKKSYKQTRPAAVRAGSGRIKAPEPAQKKTESTEHAQKKAPTQSTNKPAPAPAASKPAPKQATASASTGTAGGASIVDALRQAGYKLISDAKIAGKKIDYLAVCANHLLLCLVDSESGDWLADEERFNDEEPLWFSESNHRISPVRVILNARDALLPMLSGAVRGMEVKSMVIVRQGTIINAEDMFEVWDGLNVSVCRVEDGGPDEIATLQSVLKHVNAPEDAAMREISALVS